ncbi:MAG: hypothetical protein ACR2PV_05045 [Gammaproteobacteria bacterium]
MAKTAGIAPFVFAAPERNAAPRQPPMGRERIERKKKRQKNRDGLQELSNKSKQ